MSPKGYRERLAIIDSVLRRFLDTRVDLEFVILEKAL